MPRAWVPFAGLLVAAGLPSCDEKPEPRGAAAEAAPPAQQVEAAKPPPDPLAGLSVDELGLFFLNGRRIDLAAKDSEGQLRAALSELPVRQKEVRLAAGRNAKAQHVGALARAFGAAGAIGLDVRTPSRTGVEATLKVLPEAAAGRVPDCAVVAMIKKDNTSVVWRVRGGTAAKFSKGLGGPDLSIAYDGLKEQMSSCASSEWLLSGEENVSWGLVFDLGVLVARADPPPRATTAVLLSEAPVAGRPVSVARPRPTP